MGRERHADVTFALKRPDLFSSSVNADRAEIPAGEEPCSAPTRPRTRACASASSAPSRRAACAPSRRASRSWRAALTAAFASRGTCDVIAELAGPLPVMMIAELMGIEPERHEDFKRWADAVIIRGTGLASDVDRDELDARVAEFKTFLGDAIEARRRAPGEDLLSALVRDEDGGALSPPQALNFAVLLLLGGSETTTNLIGNALRALLADSAELARVRADLALIPAVVDEALRFDAPVQSVLRRTTVAVELGGQTIPAGAVTFLLLGSANRDEQVFPEAERFRLGRPDLKHLAFGLGPHYCLGATLARMEARAALEAVLALPNLRLARPEVELVDSFVLRGPRALARRVSARSPMPDDRVTRPALTTDEVRAFIDRAPRCKVSVHVLYQPPGVDDTVETQLVNLSRSGMFLASRGKLLDVGVTVAFQFSLDDGLVVMKGTAEVVRLALEGERGMGLRFVELDAESRELVDRIVDIELARARARALRGGGHGPAGAAGRARRRVRPRHRAHRAVGGDGGLLHVQPAHAHRHRRVLHPRRGGRAARHGLPARHRRRERPPAPALQGRVAAKQERRIGIRLVDIDRPSLLKLRAEIAKVAKLGRAKR